MRVAIVDDRIENFDIIKSIINKFLRKYDSDNIRTSVFLKGKNLIYEIQEGAYFDIFLLDIEMPGMNGIELASIIRQTNKEAYIIFITSHSQYAIEGYKVKAYNYILRNLIDDILPSILQEIRQQMELDKVSFYNIESNYRYNRIYYKDLIYMYKENKNTIFVVSGEEFKVRKSLKKVYEELNERGFIYIDRGNIVNIAHIEGMRGTEICLKGNYKLTISKSHLKNVKEKVNTYWRDRL